MNESSSNIIEQFLLENYQEIYPVRVSLSYLSYEFQSCSSDSGTSGWYAVKQQVLFTLKTAIAIAKAHVILLRKKISFCEFCFILSSTLHRIRYIDFIVCSARSSLQPASMRSNTIISVTGKGEFCRTGVIRQTCITICGTQSCNRIVPCICDFVIRHCHIKICMNHHSLIRNLPRIRRFRYTRNWIIHWLDSLSLIHIL